MRDIIYSASLITVPTLNDFRVVMPVMTFTIPDFQSVVLDEIQMGTPYVTRAGGNSVIIDDVTIRITGMDFNAGIGDYVFSGGGTSVKDNSQASFSIAGGSARCLKDLNVRFNQRDLVFNCYAISNAGFLTTDLTVTVPVQFIFKEVGRN